MSCKGACSGKKSRRPSASGWSRSRISKERTKRKRNAHFAENAQILLKKLEISTDRMSKLDLQTRRYDLSPDVIMFRAQFHEIFSHFEHFPRNEHSEFSSSRWWLEQESRTATFFSSASALRCIRNPPLQLFFSKNMFFMVVLHQRLSEVWKWFA